MLGPLLPSSALSGLQAGALQSHPKRRIAFYSHRAAPFLGPKLPAIQSGKRGVEMGGGLCPLGCGGVPRPDAGEQPAFPPRPVVPRAARSSGSSGRPPSRPRPLEGAPVLLLQPAGFAARTRGAAEVDLLVHALWRARMGAGGCRGGFRPVPQNLAAATSHPEVEPQLVMKMQQRLSVE